MHIPTSHINVTNLIKVEYDGNVYVTLKKIYIQCP